MEHTETCDICDETTTCVKNQSPLTATRKRERESARGHLSCVAVRDTAARQRHGGRLHRETSSPGTTAPGVSHRGGGEAATREGQV